MNPRIILASGSQVRATLLQNAKVPFDTLVPLVDEQSLKESCLVCLEEDPNISTLCCGKPLHFNCMSKWLSRNSTCPQCRFHLPRPPRTVIPPSASNAARDVSVDRNLARLQNQLNTQMDHYFGSLSQRSGNRVTSPEWR